MNKLDRFFIKLVQAVAPHRLHTPEENCSNYKRLLLSQFQWDFERLFHMQKVFSHFQNIAKSRYKNSIF